MFKSNLKKKSNIQILPMIDVVFFLLVFFMLFATFKTSPTGLEINLPKAKTVVTQEEEKQLTINITSNEKIYLDDQLIDQQMLEIKAMKAVEKFSDPVFIIKADKEVKYEQIVKVMDIVRKAGGYRLALAADKEKLD